MKPLERLAVAVVFGTLSALPVIASADQDDERAVPIGECVDQASVQFGHPEHGLAGGDAANHVVLPDELCVFKDGTVIFHANGPGHGIAIYPVSKNTTREHIVSQLCDVTTPGCSPMERREIRDGKDRVVIEITPGGPGVLIDSDEGRVVSAGFLIGKKPPAVPPPPAPTVMKVRFEHPGRYLVICMNRAHMVNPPWMFGFVNVTGGHDPLLHEPAVTHH